MSSAAHRPRCAGAGNLIDTRKGVSPGWKDFCALLAHLKFVKDHHRAIEVDNNIKVIPSK